MNDIEWVYNYLNSLLPDGLGFNVNDQFFEDECHWFRSAISHRIIEVSECGIHCPLYKRRKKRLLDKPIPKDNFVVAKGLVRKPRHLFEVANNPNNHITFAREYLPHIAAYSRLIIEFGYNQNLSAFSIYKRFSKDLIFKKKGKSYEIDAEFYDKDRNTYLHVEVKRNPAMTKSLVDGINVKGTLNALNKKHSKEFEYILDINPKYLWIVGPGSIDPSKYVYEVRVKKLNAEFKLIDSLPMPPC
jgi:hypothetical protein